MLWAGPVVRASLVRVKDALSKANITTVEGLEKKKTIAQILDEALEQEFPEEKPEPIGKNYNETAKQEDVGLSSSIDLHLSLGLNSLSILPIRLIKLKAWQVNIMRI